MSSNELKKTNNMMRFAALGTQWAVMLGIAVWGGHQLDLRTGWKFPVFVVTLPLIALIFSLWQLIKTLNPPKK